MDELGRTHHAYVEAMDEEDIDAAMPLPDVMARGRYGTYLHWMYGRSRVVVVSAAFDDLTSLLTEIRNRAPRAALP